MYEKQIPEPWLRGLLTELPAVPRAVFHALQLAAEDIERWCRPLTDEQMNQRPAQLAPIAFHLRHVARSIDRLLTYAEGAKLNDRQIAELEGEMSPGATQKELFKELYAAMTESAMRIRKLAGANLEAKRTVGRNKLPSTLGGLLVHIADHTQRHVGQVITTAKIVRAQSS